MIDLAILLVLLLVAAGAGRRLLRAVPFASALEETLFAIALGLGLLAYVTLALGEGGLLHRPLLVAVLAVAAWFGRREGVATAALAVRGVRRWWAGATWGEASLVALVVLLLAAALVQLFAPPVGGDQTKYQLVYPRLYAEAHRIVATPWSFWGYLQYLANMLFTAAFVLRGDVLARLVNAAFGVLGTFALFALGRRLFSRRVGFWAAVLFATMPLTATLTIRAWVEFPLALYFLLAVLAVLAWVESGASSWLGVGASMAGFAAATKIMGVLAPALLAVVVLAAALRRTSPWRAVLTAAQFGLIAALVASPCYLRNAVETGNPIFPFGYGVFGGEPWSAAAAAGLDDYYAAYRETQAARRGGHAYGRWWEALRFPWDMTMAPYAFEESGRFAYDVGPFLLAFAPGVVLLRRDRRAWILAALAAVYGAIVVFGMWAHPRYVHPTLALLLLVAVVVTERLRREGKLAARAVAAILVVTVIGQAALAVRVLTPRWLDSARVAAGRLSPEAFLRRYEPRYQLASLVHDQVPPDGTVAVLGMIPHPYYYLGRRFALASPLEQDAIDYRSIETVDEFIHALRRFGVTYVVRETDPDKQAANPVGARVPMLWDGLLRRCDKLAEADAGALYRCDVIAAEGGV